MGGEEESALMQMPIDPMRYTTPDGEDGWTFQTAGNGEFRYFKYSNYKSAVKAYDICPPVSAIINRKAQAFINGKTWVLNSKGKEAEGVQANKLRKLINNPNPLQSRRQFEAQGYIFQQIFGFNIILPIKPVGFTDPLDTAHMWNIPASWIDIEYTQEQFTKLGGVGLTEIYLNFGTRGTRIPFKVKDLIIVKDITPSFATLTFPGSKLMAQSMPINNIIGAYESRNVLINYRGALGILSQDPGKGQYIPTAMNPDEKLDLQKDFRRYGLRAKQFQVIMTTASLKWQSMGYPTKDLMLMEEVEESTVAVCAGLNFPPFILGLRDTTFNNMEQAEKSLYTNAIIPDAESYYEQLTAYFNLIEYNLRFDKDFSHIPALQPDRKTLADARKAMNEALEIEWRNGMITLDEWRKKNDEDPIPDGRGKLYFPEYVAKYGDPKKTNNGKAEGTTTDTTAEAA